MKGYCVFLSALCPRQCVSGSIMRGQWSHSYVGTLPSGYVLPSDGHRKGWTCCRLQHLGEQLHPDGSSLRTAIQLKPHSQWRKLHQPAQRFLFPHRYRHILG